MIPFQRTLLLIFLACCCSAFAEPTNTPVDQAMAAYADGRIDDAIALYKPIVSANSSDPILAANMAVLLTHSANSKDAEKYYLQALANGAGKLTNSQYAAYLLANNRAAEALTYAERGQNDKKTYGNLILARVLWKLGRQSEARRAYQTAIERNPHNDDAVDDFIPILLADRNYQLAAKLLRATISEFPEPAALYWYARTGELDPTVVLAKKEYERYLNLYPNGKYRDSCIVRLKSIAPAVDYAAIADRKMNTYLTSGPDAVGERILKAGQRYTYEVGWKFLSLGELKIEIRERKVIDGKPVWFLRYKIRSNPSIPLVTIDDEYDTYVEPGFRYATRFRMTYRTGKRYDRRGIDFDVAHNRMVNRAMDDDGYIYVSEKGLPLDTFDGISVLTWARAVVSRDKPGKAITVVDDEFKYSSILPGFTEENITVKGKSYPVRKFQAQMNYIGIAGLTGRATGWITTDNQALPVKALFEIAIGSIDIQLAKVEN